jgi:hypothetical protein
LLIAGAAGVVDPGGGEGGDVGAGAVEAELVGAVEALAQAAGSQPEPRGPRIADDVSRD